MQSFFFIIKSFQSLVIFFSSHKNSTALNNLHLRFKLTIKLNDTIFMKEIKNLLSSKSFQINKAQFSATLEEQLWTLLQLIFVENWVKK